MNATSPAILFVLVAVCFATLVVVGLVEYATSRRVVKPLNSRGNDPSTTGPRALP